MNLSKKLHPLEGHQLDTWAFSPGNIFWQKGQKSIRLIKKGDPIEPGALKKFFDYSHIIVIDEKWNDEFISLQEKFNLLLQQQREDLRVKDQEILAKHLADIFWGNKVSLSALELLELFQLPLLGKRRKSVERIKSLCVDLFLQISLKASLATGLAIIFGFGDKKILENLYSSFFDAYRHDNYSLTIKESFLKTLLDNSHRDHLHQFFRTARKDYEAFEKFLFYRAIVSFDQDLSFLNDIQQIICFTQKMFHSSEESEKKQGFGDILKVFKKTSFGDVEIGGFLSRLMQRDNSFEHGMKELFKKRVDRLDSLNFDSVDINQRSIVC